MTKNVVVTPHNRGGTVDTMKRIVGHSFDNILRLDLGENLPDADWIKA
jgi:phosphoglycerate dehydrogenase-like enzyme